MAQFDTRAKNALKQWPQWTKKLWPPSRASGRWLRAQPVDGSATHPRIMSAGTDVFKTQPDGLWVFLSPKNGFADCVAIEACSSRQNFADKRSRYSPTTTANVLHCPLEWLNGDISYKSGFRARWEFAHGARGAARRDLWLPIRFLRVLFFLEDDLYDKWRTAGVPSGHEFVASYSSIGSYNAQKMQEFLRRMSIEEHFYKA